MQTLNMNECAPDLQAVIRQHPERLPRFEDEYRPHAALYAKQGTTLEAYIRLRYIEDGLLELRTRAETKAATPKPQPRGGGQRCFEAGTDPFTGEPLASGA